MQSGYNEVSNGWDQEFMYHKDGVLIKETEGVPTIVYPEDGQLERVPLTPAKAVMGSELMKEAADSKVKYWYDEQENCWMVVHSFRRELEDGKRRWFTNTITIGDDGSLEVEAGYRPAPPRVFSRSLFLLPATILTIAAVVAAAIYLFIDVPVAV